jgi:hypothetical protein
VGANAIGGDEFVRAKQKQKHNQNGSYIKTVTEKTVIEGLITVFI